MSQNQKANAEEKIKIVRECIAGRMGNGINLTKMDKNFMIVLKGLL